MTSIQLRREQISIYEARPGDWIAFEPLEDAVYVFDVDNEPEAMYTDIGIQRNTGDPDSRMMLRVRYPINVWKEVVHAKD